MEIMIMKTKRVMSSPDYKRITIALTHILLLTLELVEVLVLRLVSLLTILAGVIS